jgi:hypothetical protein
MYVHINKMSVDCSDMVSGNVRLHVTVTAPLLQRPDNVVAPKIMRMKKRNKTVTNSLLCSVHVIYRELGSFGRYSDELGAGRPGFDSWQGQEIFLFSTASRPALGSNQPHIHGYRGLFPPR